MCEKFFFIFLIIKGDSTRIRERRRGRCGIYFFNKKKLFWEEVQKVTIIYLELFNNKKMFLNFFL